MNHKVTALILCISMAALFVVGLGMRRAVLESQYEVYGDDMPFTLESALQFRRIQQLYAGVSLRDTDTSVQVPEGIDPAKTYTLGSEYVYAALARLLPSSMPLSHRLRWIESSWFCLGIPLMALWIMIQRRSYVGGIMAAAFYAVSISSVIRSTGQELSRENFALPILIAHLAAHAWARQSEGGGSHVMRSILSGLLLAAALMSWDLIQYYVGLWSIVAFVGVMRGDLLRDQHRRTLWASEAVALFLAGLVNPYLRAHAFLLSPAMLLTYGIGLACLLHLRSACTLTRPKRCALVCAPLLLGLVVGSYVAQYGHFASLLMAKIQFLNEKPLDPSLLTFSQRIMWVPALHSASWYWAFHLFPGMLVLTLLSIPVLSMQAFKGARHGFLELLFFFSTSFITFFFFFRFHVFLSIFSAGILGSFAAWAASRVGLKRWLVLSILMLGMVYEAANVLHEPHRWGRTNVYYKQLDELTEWLGDHAEGEAVLAGFRESASILAYAGNPIVLHPKFEFPEARARVREYTELLFKGSVKDLRDWADRLGAQYVVYGLGQFASRSPQLQMRYMVDAMNPPSDVPAKQFEDSPQDVPYFQYLWGNEKYRVFKMLTAEDERRAQEHLGRARAALERGDLEEAEREALLAQVLFPRSDEALRIIKHVNALRSQGFSYDVESTR